MPVPTLVTDLSTTIASNYPSGSDNVFPSLDDTLRALSGFVASIATNSSTNGYVTPYLPLTGGTVTGATTFSSTATATKFLPTGTSATGNGMYLPAANTLGWSNNGAETMRLDSSGNLGIGTSSPAQVLDIVKSQNAGTAAVVRNANTGVSANAQLIVNADTTTGRFSAYSSGAGALANFLTIEQTTNNPIAFYVNSTEQMRLSSTGLGIGKVATTKLDVQGVAQFYSGATGTFNHINVGRTTSEARVGVAAATNDFLTGVAAGDTAFYSVASGNAWYGTASAAAAIFTTNNAERARITSGGDLLVGTTAQIAGSSSRAVFDYASADYTLRVNNSNATPFGSYISYSAAAPNGTGNLFLACADNATTRATIRSNGGLANYSGNNVNLSDRREKTNFAPAKDYLDTICAIPVQTFEYIDQSPDDPGLTLGVVAQDVQAVAPELVMESNWGTADNPKMRLSVYQTDLQYALMKCIQEQQELIKDLRARVAALEAA